MITNNYDAIMKFSRIIMDKGRPVEQFFGSNHVSYIIKGDGGDLKYRLRASAFYDNYDTDWRWKLEWAHKKRVEIEITFDDDSAKKEIYYGDKWYEIPQEIEDIYTEMREMYKEQEAAKDAELERKIEKWAVMWER